MGLYFALYADNNSIKSLHIFLSTYCCKKIHYFRIIHVTKLIYICIIPIMGNFQNKYYQVTHYRFAVECTHSNKK